MRIKVNTLFTSLVLLMHSMVNACAAGKPNYNGPMQGVLGTRDNFLMIVIMYVAIVMIIAVIPFFIRGLKKK